MILIHTFIVSLIECQFELYFLFKDMRVHIFEHCVLLDELLI